MAKSEVAYYDKELITGAPIFEVMHYVRDPDMSVSVMFTKKELKALRKDIDSALVDYRESEEW